MKKLTIVPVFIIVIISLLLTGCAGQTATTPPQALAPTAAGQKATAAPVKAGDRIVSEGAVIPAQYSYLSFATQGILGEVLITEGQSVQTGQVIARLKGSVRLQAQITATQVELLQSEQAITDLKRNADLARSDVQLRMAQANQDLDKAKEKRDSKNYKRADQSVIDTNQAQLILAQDSYDKAAQVWSYFSTQDENSVDRAGALTVLAKARQDLDRAKANYNYVTGVPDAFEVAVIDGELAVAKAKYDQAQRDWELVKDGPNPEDLALAQARNENAKAQLESAQSALADQELSAPFAGTIVSSDLKVGQTVGPGSDLVLLADLSNYMVQTTDLTELSVVNIQEGTPVKVTFDAVPGLELPGKVTRIKSLGEDKQGDITYTVFVQLDQQDKRLRWNMTASVVFETK